MRLSLLWMSLPYQCLWNPQLVQLLQPILFTWPLGINRNLLLTILGLIANAMLPRNNCFLALRNIKKILVLIQPRISCPSRQNINRYYMLRRESWNQLIFVPCSKNSAPFWKCITVQSACLNLQISYFIFASVWDKFQLIVGLKWMSENILKNWRKLRANRVANSSGVPGEVQDPQVDLRYLI